MELREEDLSLVHALQIAPRATWAELGEVLDTHPSTLSLRWERLRAAGLAWISGNFIGSTLDTSLSFVDLECGLEHRAAVLRQLCAMPAVLSVEESARNRDLMLTVVAPSLTELGREVMPTLTAIPGITKYQVSVCTATHVGAESWHVSALTRQQELALRQYSPTLQIDPREPAIPVGHWRVLRELMRDGRASAAQIARSTGIHPTTASRQLARILRAGIMTFRCDVAQPYSGFPVSCQWFARLPAGEHSRVAQDLGRHPNVRFVASTTGTTNFTIIMWLRSVNDVMAGELAIMAVAPAIELVESTLTLRFAKRMGWNLAEDGTAVGEPTVLDVPARYRESGLVH